MTIAKKNGQKTAADDMGSILEYLVDKLGVAMPTDPESARTQLESILERLTPEQYTQIPTVVDGLATRLLNNQAGLVQAGLMESLQKIRNPLIIARLMMIAWGQVPDSYQDALLNINQNQPVVEVQQAQGAHMKKRATILIVSANAKTIKKAGDDDWSNMASDSSVNSLEDAYLIMQAHGITWDNEIETGDALGEPITTFYAGGERVGEYSAGMTELIMYNPVIAGLKSSTVYNPPPEITGEWMSKAFGGKNKAIDASITMWEKTSGKVRAKWGAVTDELLAE